jgi:uroporphyrinogen decarboxylase
LEKESLKIMAWNSRSRVEAAIAHREPDRVPMDLTITQKPYERLRAALGMDPEDDLRASSFTEVTPHPEVLKVLGIDLTFIKLAKPSKWTAPEPTAEGVRFDEWGVGRKRIQIEKDVYLNEVVSSPLAGASSKDLADYPWPDPLDPGRTKGLEDEARQLYENTDLAIMGRFGGTILEQAAYLRGWEQWLMDLLINQEFARQLMDIIIDIQIALDREGIAAAGKYLSIFKLSGEDFGMQDRPLFSMQVWNDLVLPAMRRRWSAARETLDEYAPQVKLMLHSDGAIRPFIADIIACGVDILDPIQPLVPGMDLYDLKRDFGDDLVFHGGVDTQEVLPFGTTEQVHQAVLRCIDALGHGGGFILAPVHNVQADVPPENLIEMCEAVKTYGDYPLPEREPLPEVRIEDHHIQD